MRHQHFKSSRFWREDVHWDYDIGIFYFQKNITKCSVEVKSAAFITWVSLPLNGSYVTKLHYYLLLHCLLISLYFLVCILVLHAENVIKLVIFNLYWPLKLVTVEISFANCLPLHRWRKDQSVLHDKVVEYFAIRTYNEPVESSLCYTISMVYWSTWSNWSYIHIYTGCPRMNVPDFRRVFLMLCYRYNPKHLRPKLNGYGDNGQRKVWSSGGSTHCTCQLTSLIDVYPWVWCPVTEGSSH